MCISPVLAAVAAALPGSFAGDPADRLIYATAIGHGWPLVIRTRRLRDHPQPPHLALGLAHGRWGKT